MRDLGPWKKALLVVLVTHVAFIALAWAGSYFLSGAPAQPTEGFTDLWRRWDTEHYVDIAEHGYDSPETYEHAEAFFPLYPLTIAFVSLFGIDPVVAGMLVSAICSVIALAYLYKLAEDDLFPGAGRRAILLMSLFPTAVFLTAAYSEALFLAGAIPAFYYARRREWHLVALPAAVAVGTRVAGVFVLMGLVAEFLSQRDFDRKKVWKLAGVCGIALIPLFAYMGYLWAANDSPFHFFQAQEEGWDRVLTSPISALNTTMQGFNAETPANWLIAWRAEVLAAAAGIFFTVWAFRKKEFGYAVYMGALMIPLLTSNYYLSIPRMLLSMFPIVLLVVGVTRDEGRYNLVLGVSSLFAALGVLVFTRGQWFF